MVGTIPIISPLFQRFDQDPDNANRRFVKELTDRVVITWTVSEPYRDVLSFASDPLLNRFQIVLHGDGTIEISYDEIHVEDGIVGIFPPLSTEQQDLDVVTDATDPEIPKYIDTLSVTVSLVGDHSVRFEFQTLGAILPEGDPRIKSVAYRVWVDVDEPFITMPDFEEADVNWGIGGSPQLTYQTSGPGVSPNLEIDGNTIAVTAFLDALNGADRFAFFTDTVEFDESDAQPAPYDRTDPILVTLPNLPSSTVDLSALSVACPSRGFVFEEFHHADLSNPQEAELDLACAVINALGDRFDFLVFYTDFRLDRIVASAPGLGGIGEGVSGVVESFGRPEDWCSDGQLQGGQSVSYIGSPILHASEGTDLVGTFGNYNRQVFLLSHELGHRWLSPMRALVGGQTRTIADTDGHWFFELHAPAAFPITAEADNSPMGGSLWQDNGDGTFTLFPRPFFQAGGYSYLDLYLMGFLPQEDVPAFFLIEDAQFVGSDTDGNEVHRGTRIDISVEDEIAENGPRLPIFEASQKEFNIGFIGIVQPGRAPSQQLLERMMGIRRAFFDYWSAATGGVSTMNDALQRTLQFAQLGNGEGLASDIVLTNPSATETVSGHIDFFDDNGSKLPVGITDTGVRTLVNFSVPPLAEVTVSTDGQGDVVVGSAVVTADNVLGGAVRFDLSGIGIAGVGSSPPLIGFVAPVRRLAGGINTGVAIYNMGSQAVTLNLTLRNPQGEVVPNGTRTITDFPVAGHLAQFFGGDGEVLFPDADTDDFAGTLVVEVTGGRVAATALELGTEAGQFTTLSVTPTGAVTSTPGKLYFADFANGSGLTSELVLVNPSASDVISGRVDFFDGEGLPLLMGLAFGEASCVEFEIPALGTTTIASDGQGQIAVGSAVVSSEKRLGGVVRFDISGIGIAGVGSSERLEGFITPVRRQLEGINTGVAIHNIESHPVTLSLTLRDKLGTPVSKGTRTIEDFPAGGQLAQFFGGDGEVLFPDADTDDFEGTLVVEVTDGAVAATALELGTEAGQFTTLPVTPLN